MKRDIFLWFSPIILLFLLIQGTGCSTIKSAYQATADTAKSLSSKVMPAKKSEFKKRVLVLPVLDQAGMGEAKIDQITDTLVELLEKDGHLLVHKAPKSIPSFAKMRSPKYGIVTDHELAKQAEEMGMDILITSVLSPFEWISRKVGLWPLLRSRREVEISMVVNALDIINGTLILTSQESRKIKIKIPDDEDEGVESKKEIDDERLSEELSTILKRQASAIIKGIIEQPWSGRILSASDEIIINAGKDVGIKEDSVFNVFGKGDPIKSVSGRTVYLLGPKVGEIKTVKVMDTHSSAAPLTNGSFKAGQIIRLK